MTISTLTAMMICNRDDIQVTYGGPDLDHGKYVGYVTLGPKDYYRTLLNTEPIFNSSDDAITHMNELILKIKRDFSNE